MTIVKFQADADLNKAIFDGTLRKQANIDFRSAYEAGLEGKDDQEVLEISAHEGRVLVTHDRRTMPTEFGKFILSQTSAGVLIVPQKFPIGDTIDSILLIWEASIAEEWINRITSLPI